MKAWLPHPSGPALLGDVPAELTVEVWDPAGPPGQGPADPPSDPVDVTVWVPPFMSGPQSVRTLERLPGVRVVQLLSAGADAWVGRLPAGVTLCDAQGVHSSATAEWVVTAILAAVREIPRFVHAQAAGRWDHRATAELAGSRVLILGAGDIGEAVHRRLEPFDVETVRVARRARPGVHATADLPELLPTVDVVVVLVPLTDATRGMVDAAFLARMRDGALLVNAARGPSSTPTHCSPSSPPDGCGPPWTSPIPSRCPPGTRCGRRPGCCSPRTSRAPSRACCAGRTPWWGTSSAGTRQASPSRTSWWTATENGVIGGTLICGCSIDESVRVVSDFVGRHRELASLDRVLARVVEGGRAGRPGRAILMRGRRRVGKSRLVEEFVERSGVPHLFFTAPAQPDIRVEVGLFVEAARQSDLPGAEVFEDQSPTTWEAALRLLVAALPRDRPSVVVLDEMPYLVATDPGFEGTLQKVFDRELSRLPVLLVCVGSDLAMMEALNGYGRPFHQRATEMVVPPLDPAAVAGMLDLSPADAIDAFLITGGLPLILDEWPRGASVTDYLTDAVADPTSALLVSAERMLAAEFPVEAQARRVLGAIGSGERSYALIGRAAGDLPQASLGRALGLLTAKRLVDAATPLSTRPSRETRYTVADPYLRFWSTFLGPRLAEIERGRGDLVLRRIEASWTSWRGRAVEPVVREALRRLPDRLPDRLPGETAVIGAFWTRTHDPEIDLVGADREPVANRITLVGSITWQDTAPFDGRDLGRLLHHRGRLPGATDDTPLVVVSRTGSAVPDVPVLTPADLLTAWRQEI